jgi:hypothetical protein
MRTAVAVTSRMFPDIAALRINWDNEQSGYAENPDNSIFLSQQATLAVLISVVAIYSI